MDATDTVTGSELTAGLLLDGEAALAAGRAQEVLAACRRAVTRAGEARLDDRIVQLAGDAAQLCGEWREAQRYWWLLVPPAGPIAASVAWRLGAMLYLQGDRADADEVLSRASTAEGSPADCAAVSAWAAAAAWGGGDRNRAAALVGRAVELATAARDARSLAAAYTVMAMVAAVDGDREANLRYDALALDHAAASGDLQQVSRIRCNRGSHLTEQGDYARAVGELDEAVRLADLCGSVPFRALSRSNRGEALVQLGRYDEAVADLEEARAIFQHAGSKMELHPLTQLAEVHAIRGNHVLARAHFDDAIRIATDAGDVQGLVVALSGLAIFLADGDPGTARALATHATSLDGTVAHPRALVAAGWAALGAGDRLGAATLAERTISLARQRRDLRTLGDAVELGAALGADPERRIALLDEAVAIWGQLRSPLGVARARLALAESRSGPAATALAQSAADALATLGARPLAGRARSFAASCRSKGTRNVTLQLFGGFALWRAGVPVAASEWRSTTAREVLAMLAVGRGRPVHREVLIERLWPDADLDKASNRLSVALSTIRRVTGDDRQAVLVAQGDAVRLVVDAIDVDVERFFTYATAGRQAVADGHVDQALALYRLAEESYGGTFFAEDPFSEWAAPVREESSLTFGTVVRELARADAASGDHAAASRRYLRLIEHDPFDEAGHLGAIGSLVALGAFGQAQRLYGSYAARMAELNVDPAPFPQR